MMVITCTLLLLLKRLLPKLLRPSRAPKVKNKIPNEEGFSFLWTIVIWCCHYLSLQLPRGSSDLFPEWLQESSSHIKLHFFSIVGALKGTWVGLVLTVARLIYLEPFTFLPIVATSEILEEARGRRRRRIARVISGQRKTASN